MKHLPHLQNIFEQVVTYYHDIINKQYSLFSYSDTSNFRTQCETKTI